MKHNFIKAASLPKFTSRRFGQNLGSAAYKSDAETQADELVERMKTQFEGELQKRGFVSQTDVDAKITAKTVELETRATALQTKIDEQATKATAQQASIEAQGLELRAMKEAQKASLPDRKTIAMEIRSFLDKNKDKWEAFKAGESKSFGTDGTGNGGIELRAAITMGVTGSTGGSAFVPGVEIVGGLVDLARNKPFIENYANSSNTTKSRIVWAEKYNPQGNATFLGEGGVKQLISFEIRTLESYAKKVADKIKVSTEMLEDVDFIAAEIENELKYKVDMAVDASLLAGAGDGTNATVDMKGLTSYVGGYVLTTVLVKTPNNQDAIRAVIAQIVSLNFTPDSLFLNPIDAANMDLIKDANGRPIAKEYKDDNGRIFRLLPIETNQMPVGNFLIGDMTRFKIRNYKPFAISYGWVNDDFERNLVTILGERRLHSYVAANDIGAFVYGTFATVKTAITAV